MAQPLAGTERPGVSLFWSPDSRSIGFYATNQLKRIDLDTGLVRVLAGAPNYVGGTWNNEGTILFAPSPSTPLMRIGAGGRGLAEATHLDPPRQVSHRFPYFLPDGRHFIFLALGGLENRGVYIGSLDSRDTHRLFEADAPAKFLPPDLVLFVRDGALLAQRLNLDTLQMEGDPVPVATHVTLTPGNFNAIAASPSRSGLLAYRANDGARQSFWVDRVGRQIGMLGGPDAAQPSSDEGLSPDGRTVVRQRTVNGNTDIWLIDVERGMPRRSRLKRFASAPQSGLLMAAASRSRRSEQASSTSMRGLLTEPQPRGCLSVLPTPKSSKIGRRTANSFCTPCKIHRLASTSGSCRSRATASRCLSHACRLRSEPDDSRLTAAGSPTHPMRPDRVKSTFSHFLDPVARCRSRPVAVASLNGATMGVSCSTWGRTTE